LGSNGRDYQPVSLDNNNPPGHPDTAGS
jgi:hypothetical protein